MRAMLIHSSHVSTFISASNSFMGGIAPPALAPGQVAIRENG
jgi:hypothetical protein